LVQIEAKSEVLGLGLELDQFSTQQQTKNLRRIVWNHRWEYDKNPEEFFKLLFALKEDDVRFELVVLGKQFSKVPTIFEEARKKLAKEIIHWGYCRDRKEYAHILSQCNISPVTSRQDFFGISTV